ncbi:MAG: preprotein translocase subunit SecY [Lachnospiraceae bacterium]|nr:preprotein translocase subunit SecY [Lachnospiraceae bacterium]
MQKEKQQSIIKYKLIFTVLVILIYMFGREIPLYMTDIMAYRDKGLDTSGMLMQAISGDIYMCSIFALGITPYMISSIIVQIVSAFRSNEQKAKIAPSQMTKLSLASMLIIAIVQAALQSRSLQFTVTGQMMVSAQIIATLEMVTGAVIIVWLSSANRRYGIGGQSPLILLNVLDSIKTILDEHSAMQLILPFLIAFVVMVVTIIFENTEMRIPVQRISIHNIYADRNYLAIKLHPIGVMPAMFSTAVFVLPQMVVGLLSWVWPENSSIIWWQDNMVLDKPLGIAMYVLVLYILTIGFSRVFLNPKEITEQYLKSGDSLQDIHAGVETRKYLSRAITCISFISATAMSVCLTIPMALQAMGYMEATLTTVPTMSMMLTGVWCNIYREYRAVRDLEAYKPFI